MSDQELHRALSGIATEGDQWKAIEEILQTHVDDAVADAALEGVDDSVRQFRAGSLNQALIVRNHFLQIREDIRKAATL